MPEFLLLSFHSLMMSVSAFLPSRSPLSPPQGDRGPVGPTGPVGEKGPMVSAVRLGSEATSLCRGFKSLWYHVQCNFTCWLKILFRVPHPLVLQHLCNFSGLHYYAEERKKSNPTNNVMVE